MSVCPLCTREMLDSGPSVDRHHLLPKSKGGKEQFLLHRLCHQKIHSLFTENELRDSYTTWAALKGHPDIQTFIQWIRKKPIDYYDRNVRAARKKR